MTATQGKKILDKFSETVERVTGVDSDPVRCRLKKMTVSVSEFHVAPHEGQHLILTHIKLQFHID